MAFLEFRSGRPPPAAAATATADNATDQKAKTDAANSSTLSFSNEGLLRVRSRSRPEAREPASSLRGAGANRDNDRPRGWLEFFCVIGVAPGEDLEAAGGPERTPILLDRYPKEDCVEVEFPAHLPDFCFPDGGCRPLRCQTVPPLPEGGETNSKEKRKDSKVQHHHPEPFLYSMVLTSGSGQHLYCTVLTVYETRAQLAWGKKTEIGATTAPDKTGEHYWIVPKCLVLLSQHPFFQAQASALKELFYTVQSGTSLLPFERYVAHLLDVPLPRDGTGRGMEGQGHTVVEWTSWVRPLPATVRLERPPPNQLPLLNVSMELLFRTLSLSNVLVLWATLLREGKVVLSCSRRAATALLVPIAEALRALLFPFEWRGLYVPVLPNRGAALEVLQAPVPYLIGLVRNPADARTHAPQSQPSGALWCDIDEDVLHLGVDDENTPIYGEKEDLIPALPSEAAMTLKMELEELVDPLYLPTMEGIKGRMTVGDRELDNASREPYAPRTKLFAVPVATPRKYILMQSSSIPPRGTVSRCEGFQARPIQQRKIVRKNMFTGGEKHGVAMSSERKAGAGKLGSKDDPLTATTANQDSAFLLSLKQQGRFMQAQIDRALTTLGRDHTTYKELGSEDEPNPCITDQHSSILLSLRQQGSFMQAQVDRALAALRQDDVTSNESILKEKPNPFTADQDSTFLLMLKQQGRFVQEHIDHALTALGQDFATTKQPGSEEGPTAISSDQDSTILLSLYKQGRIMQECIDRALAGQDLAAPNPNLEAGATDVTTDQNSSFLLSLKQQSRYVQTHIDRAFAILGQDYATPSEYAVRSSQQLTDVLCQQDDVVAKLFNADGQKQCEVTNCVRKSFLRFFLAVFARYKFFLDKTNRLDTKRFTASLNLPERQREYVKEVVTSQMFVRFLQDTNSIRNRKLFDEYICKRAKGSFGRGGKKSLTSSHTTPLLDSSQWNKPTIIIPDQPCHLGLKKGHIYCRDRRFPDSLDPDECITNESFSF